MSLTSFLDRFTYGRGTTSASSAAVLEPARSSFTFGGVTYPFGLQQTMPGQKQEPIGWDFLSLVEGAYRTNGVVFACMLARLSLFSEARFQFRQIRNGRPGALFGTPALGPLERPWPGGTTGDLLARAIQDHDLAGNFFCARLAGGRLKRLRPDWVTIVTTGIDIDSELVGYVYKPGGNMGGGDAVMLMPHEVAHFSTTPDPVFEHRGMSWLTPVVAEITGDKAMTDHKRAFFENGATVNLVVKLDAAIQAEQFRDWVQLFNEKHRGRLNAYETLFLGGGADAKAIGANLEEVAFKAVQGAGETRIAAAAGVPPIIVGLSEGLQAATYSNYGQARRRFADGTMRFLWREFCAAMATIVDVPDGAELWYDDRDIAFLQEDMRDAAEIQQMKAATIRQLVDAGFTPDSVVAAVEADDNALLEHTNLFSVQLQPPGTPAASSNGQVEPDAAALLEKTLAGMAK